MTLDDDLPPRLPLPLPRVVTRKVARGAARRWVTELLDRDGRAWRLRDVIRAEDGRWVTAPTGSTVGRRVFTAADTGERRAVRPDRLDRPEEWEPRVWDARWLQPQLDRARVVRAGR